MSYTYQSSHRPKKSYKKVLIVCAVIILALLAYFFVIKKDSSAPNQPTSPEESQSEEAAQPAYQAIDLQPVVNSWLSNKSADYHISIYDFQAGKVIGQNQPETTLFAASLYKIYVAYLSLLDFQTGAQSPDDILIAGQTKKECVDKMIRSSDSPCGEAMMAEIGQSTLNRRVADMGMTGTFFNGIRTSAVDSSLILQHIQKKRDLNDENTAFLLDAMLTQDAKFKRGLQTGAPEAIWNTKVGWNEDANYHDIGIMTMPDGRKFAVAILSQGQGSASPIADFSSTIYSALKQ